MQESSKGRRLTAQERQELMRSPVKLLQTLLGPLGVLYSGLKPAAIETVASQAVSGEQGLWGQGAPGAGACLLGAGGVEAGGRQQMLRAEAVSL